MGGGKEGRDRDRGVGSKQMSYWERAHEGEG